MSDNEKPVVIVHYLYENGEYVAKYPDGRQSLYLTLCELAVICDESGYEMLYKGKI